MGIQGNQNSANAQLANTTATGQQNLIGGLMNGAGGVLSSVASNPETLALAKGGQIAPKKYADGGPAFDPMMQPTKDQQVTDQSQNAAGPQSSMGKMLSGFGSGMSGASDKAPKSQLQAGASNLMSGAFNAMFGSQQPTTDLSRANDVESSPSNFNNISDSDQSAPDQNQGMMTATSAGPTAMAAEGGKVPALVSPGEIRIHAKDVPKIAQGQKSPLDGEKIPGKPKVGGAKNSYANDTVPKTLNSGDIILPRSVTQSKNPATAAHKFVSAIMAKNGKSMPKRAK